MTPRSERFFQLLFTIGVLLIIASFFFDWFLYAHIGSTIINAWGFNLFSGWTSYTSDTNNIPSLLEADILLISLYAFLVAFSAFALVYIKFEIPGMGKTKYYEKVKSLGIAFPIMAGFNLLISCMFLCSLVTSHLYFPFVVIGGAIDGPQMVYCIGPGLILHLATFPLVLPYSIFLSTLPFKFNVKEAISIENTIDRASKKIDYDKIILKEKINPKGNFPIDEQDDQEIELDSIELGGEDSVKIN